MKLNVNNLIKWFQLKYPKIVKSMHNSSHHYKEGEILNPYHMEGDVWTHTMMVMLEAERMSESVDGNEYIHLLVLALLHDIGKPMARKENHEKQRVHFWGHEPISAFLCIPILDEIEKEFKVLLNKRLIIEVISMHTDVYNIPRKKLGKRLVANRHLATLLSKLSDCDYSGRFFEMGDRDMENIDLESDREAFDYHKQVVCYIGLPCSGKSTHIKKLIGDRKGWVVLSRDDIVMQLGLEQGFTTYNESFKKVDQKEVDRIFQARRSDYIKKELNVAIDMTNMGRKSRRKNMNGFGKDYMKSAVVMMTPLDTIVERNENRDGKTIPDHVFENMINSFKPPLYDEFYEIDWEFD